MAYAAALLLGLALLWLGWAPQALSQYWLICGGAGIVLAALLALLMRASDSEGAPYLRLLLSAPRSIRDAGRIATSSVNVAARTMAGEPMLAPALVHLKSPAGGDAPRVAHANAVARAPGGVVVDIEDDSLLVHVLVENDRNEAVLRRMGP